MEKYTREVWWEDAEVRQGKNKKSAPMLIMAKT